MSLVQIFHWYLIWYLICSPPKHRLARPPLTTTMQQNIPVLPLTPFSSIPRPTLSQNIAPMRSDGDSNDSTTGKHGRGRKRKEPGAGCKRTEQRRKKAEIAQQTSTQMKNAEQEQIKLQWRDHVETINLSCCPLQSNQFQILCMERQEQRHMATMRRHVECCSSFLFEANTAPRCFAVTIRTDDDSNCCQQFCSDDSNCCQ